MIDDEREKRNGPRGSAPLPISGIRTEYHRLCEHFGGPADIGAAIGNSTQNLAMYCGEYESHCVLPVLLHYQPDENLARRLWPWAAFAISHYVWEIQERKKYSDEPRPEEVDQLLSQIAQSAHDLSSGLCRLHALSYRLRDPTAQLRRAHLGWLDAFIAQAAAGLRSNEVNENGQQMLIAESAKSALLKQLAEVEAAAKAARKRADWTLLSRERGQANPALLNFVFRCGVIWKSLTKRQPSANKVVYRDGRKEPDFVIFIQELAQVGQAPVPSRRQVEISLRKIRRTD